MTDKLDLALQNASSSPNIPSEAELQSWVAAALQDPNQNVEITLRFVDAAEGRELNRDYRDKDYATNVLTFTFSDDIDDDMPAIAGLPLMGDLVFCCEVIEREAIEQNKPLLAHYCHMVVHGTLHLQGFDHIIDDEAETMESLETQIVTGLGYDDPYLSEKS
jgi:probable rRNA maturation factor